MSVEYATLRVRSRCKQAAILDSAGEEFALHGYEGSSVEAITRAANVSKGTLYNYYRSKEELFGAFVERECERVLAPFFDDLILQESPSVVLEIIGLRIVEFLLSPPAATIDRVVTAEAWRFPELSLTFFRAGPGRGIAVTADWLRRETAVGRLLVPDPEFAAEQFWHLCHAHIVLRRRLRIECLTPGVPPKRVVEQATRMFLAVYKAH